MTYHGLVSYGDLGALAGPDSRAKKLKKRIAKYKDRLRKAKSKKKKDKIRKRIKKLQAKLAKLRGRVGKRIKRRTQKGKKVPQRLKRARARLRASGGAKAADAATSSDVDTSTESGAAEAAAKKADLQAERVRLLRALRRARGNRRKQILRRIKMVSRKAAALPSAHEAVTVPMFETTSMDTSTATMDTGPSDLDLDLDLDEDEEWFRNPMVLGAGAVAILAFLYTRRKGTEAPKGNPRRRRNGRHYGSRRSPRHTQATRSWRYSGARRQLRSNRRRY